MWSMYKIFLMTEEQEGEGQKEHKVAAGMEGGEEEIGGGVFALLGEGACVFLVLL